MAFGPMPQIVGDQVTTRSAYPAQARIVMPRKSRKNMGVCVIGFFLVGLVVLGII